MAVKLGLSSQGQTQIEGIREQEAEENKQMGQRKETGEWPQLHDLLHHLYLHEIL